MKTTNRRQLAYLALGANLDSPAGLPEKTIPAALEALDQRGIDVTAVSHFYRTPCFPASAGPDYVNACVAVETSLSPDALLLELHGVEQAFGRERKSRWAGRSLDIDLIAFGDMVLPDVATFETWRNLPLSEQMKRAPDQLILPHPRLHERGFVLIPLCDVAPDWRHPILAKTVAEMRDTLPPEAITEVKQLKTQ